MNFRITTLLFGIFLATLWVFGLMLAWTRGALDLGFVFPKLADERKIDISSLEISQKDGKKLLFTRAEDDSWRMVVPPQKQELRVLDKKIEELVNEIRSARHSFEETPDIRRGNPEDWGLAPPNTTVTLKNAKGGQWQLFLGKESGDNAYVFVNSSERPRDVLSVKRATLANVFLEADDFRSRTLLDPQEGTTKRLAIKDQRDGKSIVLQRVKEKHWRFEQPPLGPAEYEGKLGGKSEDSVTSLIRTLGNIRAEKFEPLGSLVTMEDQAKALLRIEVDVEGGKGKGEGGVTKQVLLIGGEIKDDKQYFARLESEGVDKAVVRVSAEQLKPIFELLKKPGSLRSLDVSQIDPDGVDAIELSRDKDYVKLFKGKDEMVKDFLKGKESWDVFSSDAKPMAGNERAIADLLTAIVGKQEIKENDFLETDTPESIKKLEEKFTASKPEVIKVFADSLQPAKKDETKPEAAEPKKDEPAPKEAGKDQPKADDKQPAKDDKKQADEKKDDKKDDKKSTKTPPKFKDNAKPELTLSIVKFDKDKWLVKRETPGEESKDGKDKEKDKDKKEISKPIVSYFTVAKAAYDKIVPSDSNMALTFYDTDIKPFTAVNANKLELVRVPAKDRTKAETLLVQRDSKDKDKDKTPDAEKGKETDKDKLGEPKDKDKEPAGKAEWKLIEPKDFPIKGDVESNDINGILLALSNFHAVRWAEKASEANLSDRGLGDKNWTVKLTVTSKKQEGDKEEPKPFVLRVGEVSNRPSDKEGVFAFQEGTDYIFVLENRLEKMLKEAEFRDKHVLSFDSTKVKEFKVFVTMPDNEVRKPVFQRDAEKQWKDIKENIGFKIDSRKVDTLIEKLSTLLAVRYLSVRSNDKGELPAEFKEYKLGDGALLKFEVVMEDGKTHTVNVGAASEKSGPYYAQCNALPGYVFLVAKDPFDDLMGKVTYFRKD